MKNYNIIAKSNNQDKSFSVEKIKDFLRNELGYNLNPVQGTSNKFWVSGKYIENAFKEFIDGSKYYKLIINDSDFGISASGDFNAFQMSGIIRDEIKQAIN
tara:strand:+ start:11902 stop:12204 length:303 start_codon:yes stop_codon:yes gene_type:complete